MNRVRFHLAQGRHYQHFQIRHADGTVSYHDPDSVQLVMRNCRLHNQNRVAEAICAGRNKTVCAWVVCESVEIVPHDSVSTTDSPIYFNPRKVPYWTDGKANLDGKTFPEIFTSGRNLYLK